MNLINNNLQKIIPSNVDESKIGFDSKLGEVGLKIYKWLDSMNKIEPSHSFNSIIYRWAFGTSGDNSINYILNRLPSDLSDLFLNDVINYLGISDFSVNEIKFEKLGPNKFLEDVHLKRTRFGDLITTQEDDLSTIDGNAEVFYSALWHTDKFFKLNNYKILVYLNEVDKNEGGLIVSDPHIHPKWINNKAVLIDDGVSVKSNEITFKEVTGLVGTTASFSSHILHRANLPKNNYRMCMHLSFCLPGEQYEHEKYSNNHFRGI
jgi:hypothetical protein